MKPYCTTGFERRELSIGGIRTVVYVAGSGPDVVYLHGGGTFHGFEFARDWLSQFRVWLPYHPGFGESADATDLKTLHSYALHCRALFDELRLKQLSLVGASLGGLLAAKFTLAFPERVRALVLVAPAGIVLPAFPIPDFSKLSHADWPHYLVYDQKVVRPFWPDNPDASFVAAFVREARCSGRLMAEGVGTQREFVKALKSLRTPTLLIWGSEDRMMPVGNATGWLEQLSGATLTVIDRAGHLLLDESKSARNEVARFLSASGTLPEA